MIRLAVVLASSLALASIAGDDPTGSWQSAACLPNVSCDRATSRVLETVMKLRGGRERLNAVKSVVVEGNRRLSSGTSLLFTYRMLMPDKFQEVSQLTFTVDGNAFWSAPPARPGAVEHLRTVKTRLFAEQSLVLLLRVPPTLPMRAELTNGDWNGESRPVVRFTNPGGFELTLVLNSAADRVDGFLQPGSFGAPMGDLKTVVRRVVFVRFDQVDGITIPVSMKESIAAGSADIELTRARFDAEVTPEQFRKPRLP